jgi:hypothetical protein
MSKTIEFFMNRPELVDKLPIEMKQLLLEAVREQLANIRRGGVMPQSVYDACTAVVDDKLMRDIVADARRSNSPGWLPPQGKVDLAEVNKPDTGKPVERGTGWSPLDPISPPPGIKYIDQMIDVQDALDKIKLEGKFKRRI